MVPTSVGWAAAFVITAIISFAYVICEAKFMVFVENAFRNAGFSFDLIPGLAVEVALLGLFVFLWIKLLLPLIIHYLLTL